MNRRSFMSLSLCGALFAGALQAQTPTVLRVATETFYRPFDPQSAALRFFYTSQTHETLLKIDAQGRLRANLAASWRRTGTNTWSFTLRDDVRFHDGTILDAQAVVLSYENFLLYWPFAQNLLRIKKMTAQSRLILEMETDGNFPNFPYQIAHSVGVVHAPSSFDKAGRLIRPMGTGPWQLEDHLSPVQTSVRRFESYWGEAPAPFERIEFHSIAEEEQRLAALAAQEVDVLMDVPHGHAHSLEKNEAYTLHQSAGAGTAYLAYNCARDRELSNTLVRRAINALIERNILIEGGLDGMGTPSWSLFAPNSGLPMSGGASRYDPKSAHKLLRSAGYTSRNGRWYKGDSRLTLHLLVERETAGLREIGQMIAHSLRREGIDCRVELGPERGLTPALERGQYDMALKLWVPETALNPDEFLRSHFKGSAVLNAQNWLNEDFDAAVDAMRTLERGPQWETLFLKALTILHEEAVIAPLVQLMRLTAVRRDLEGFEPPTTFGTFKFGHLA